MSVPSGLIEAAIDRVKQGLVPLEIIWPTETSEWPLAPAESSACHISVLDSSFNPPTRAHLALASASPLSAGPGAAPYGPDYDARLLLLSVRNADKQLKPGDASFTQRVEMMVLLAMELDDLGHKDVAVAVIDEPGFEAKSTKIHQFLRDKLATSEITTILTFLMGTDTITRFFSPSYYASEEAMIQAKHHFFNSPSDESQPGEGCRVACARRASDLTEEEEDAFFQSAHVQPHVASGAIGMIDIGDSEAQMSSTKVRHGRREASQGRAPEKEWEAMCLDSVSRYIRDTELFTT